MKRIAVLGVVLAVLLAGGWIGGEMHYKNCVHVAEGENPIRYEEATGQYGDAIGGYELGRGPEAGSPAHYVGLASRKEAINDCSRWP